MTVDELALIIQQLQAAGHGDKQFIATDPGGISYLITVHNHTKTVVNPEEEIGALEEEDAGFEYVPLYLD